MCKLRVLFLEITDLQRFLPQCYLETFDLVSPRLFLSLVLDLVHENLSCFSSIERLWVVLGLLTAIDPPSSELNFFGFRMLLAKLLRIHFKELRLAPLTNLTFQVVWSIL